jgi:hypothetical protein
MGLSETLTYNELPQNTRLNSDSESSFQALREGRQQGDFMTRLEFELARLRRRVSPLERLLHLVATTLEPPELVDIGNGRGFRFSQPGLTHFCLLRGARIVSALNAAIELARVGYPQEIAVLLRTMIEYTTQIDFMLESQTPDGKLSDQAAAFIEDYFQDAKRPPPATAIKRKKLNQEKVHKLIGARLDNVAGDGVTKRADEMLSNIYFIFSNYVHGRYPESMDLYGGRPGRFHLQGMSGTPKDLENIAALESMITSASNCFKGLILGLRLQSTIKHDSTIVEWCREDPEITLT